MDLFSAGYLLYKHLNKSNNKTTYRCNTCGYTDYSPDYCIKCKECSEDAEAEIKRKRLEWENAEKERLNDFKKQLEKDEAEEKQRQQEKIEKLEAIMNGNNVTNLKVFKANKSPLASFKACDPKGLVKLIGDRVQKDAYAGVLLENMVNDISSSIEKELKNDYKQFEPTLKRYEDYANKLKSIKNIVVDEFNGNDVDDDDEDVGDAREHLQNQMKGLCNLSKQILEQMSIVELCYQDMKEDYKFFVDLCNNTIEDYQNQNKEIQQDIKDFCNNINDNRTVPQCKQLVNKNDGSYWLEGGLIGGSGGAIAVGECYGPAIVGFLGGAVVGGLIGSLFEKKQNVHVKNKLKNNNSQLLDGKKHKQLLNILQDKVSKSLTNHIGDWENKKDEMTEKQTSIDKHLTELNTSQEKVERFVVEISGIITRLNSPIIEYDEQNLKRRLETLKQEMKIIAQQCQIK